MRDIIENIRVAIADWILPRKYVAMRITRGGGVQYIELTQEEYRRLQ